MSNLTDGRSASSGRCPLRSHVIRSLRTPVSLYVRASTVQRRRDLFSEALEVIARRHGDPDLTLASVAHEIATSRRQLQRALAEVGGTSFSRELQRVRMERAAELLLGGSLPVQVVAGAVGYRQAAQFAKVFRRHHGVSPSMFRRSSDQLAA
jgi:AraC family transcriptional regulator, regulatory protein of adaptative response / methylphosphotriester-DNA alkyltransferase methyltransferase